MIVCPDRIPLLIRDPLALEIELNLSPFAFTWSTLGDFLYACGTDGVTSEMWPVTPEQYEWIVEACARLHVEVVECPE